MEILGWLGANWFDVLQTAAILFGFGATIHTIRADTHERKIENMFAVTAAHTDLWMRFADRPTMHRIKETQVDLEKNPPTLVETLFVHELILHLRTSFRAREAGMEFDDDAVTADIRQFFTRPIPRWVWERSKVFQGNDFVAFVEEALQD